MGPTNENTAQGSGEEPGDRPLDVERIFRWIRALAFKYASASMDGDDAEDVAQKVTMRFFEQMTEAPEQFVCNRGHVATAVRNELKDHHRRCLARKAREIAYNDVRVQAVRQRDYPASAQFNGDRNRAWADALSQLSPLVRSDWVQVHLDGTPIPEVAAARGVTEAAIKFNLASAFKTLRALLPKHCRDEVADDGAIPPAMRAFSTYDEGKVQEAR